MPVTLSVEIKFNAFDKIFFPFRKKTFARKQRIREKFVHEKIEKKNCLIRMCENSAKKRHFFS